MIGPKLPDIKKEKKNFGWQVNVEASYPEKFWEKVLLNNNVPYVKQVKVKSPKKRGVYKLDFLIGNINFEIDGEQHKKPERIEHDKIRDAFLKDNGYIVYRLDWVNPDSEPRKKIVNTQIRRCSKIFRIS